jgi:uncharacterized protein YaiI (UPF0178 family)
MKQALMTHTPQARIAQEIICWMIGSGNPLPVGPGGAKEVVARAYDLADAYIAESVRRGDITIEEVIQKTQE